MNDIKGMFGFGHSEMGNADGQYGGALGQGQFEIDNRLEKERELRADAKLSNVSLQEQAKLLKEFISWKPQMETLFDAFLSEREQIAQDLMPAEPARKEEMNLAEQGIAIINGKRVNLITGQEC